MDHTIEEKTSIPSSEGELNKPTQPKPSTLVDMSNNKATQSRGTGRSDSWYIDQLPSLLAQQTALERGSQNSSEVAIIFSVRTMIRLLTLFGHPSARCKEFKRSSHKQGYKPRTILEIRILYSLISVCKKLLRLDQINGKGTWVKIIKWKICSFFSYHMGQDIPLAPKLDMGDITSFSFLKPHIYLPGYTHDWLNRLRVKDNNFFIRFVHSTLNLKKGMHPVPDEMLEKAKVDTRIELTSPPKPQPDIQVGEDTWTPFTLNQEVCKRELRRTVRECFEKAPITAKAVFEPFFPSTSANYNRSRFNGGAVGFLYDRYKLGNEQGFMSFSKQLEEVADPQAIHYGTCGITEADNIKTFEELDETIFTPNDEDDDKDEIDFLFLKKDFKYLKAKEFFFDFDFFQDNMETGDDDNFVVEASITSPYMFLSESKEAFVYKDAQLRARWKPFYSKLFTDSVFERPLVEVVALSEPLKVRPISKGPPLKYTALKVIQKHMWGTLKSLPAFQLIGRPCTPEDINRVLKNLKEHEIALSGDYVSSTNRLHSWVSECLVDEYLIIIEETISDEDLAEIEGSIPNFFQSLRSILFESMTQHIFVENVNGSESEYKQTEGQLMGSIVSFPFLCMANAALCRFAMEIDGGEPLRLRNLTEIEYKELKKKPYRRSRDFQYPPRPIKALFNGDDCLLRGGQGLRNLWELILGYCGLESSLGKTYFSNKFCTINSELYTLDQETAVWHRQRQINVGIMLGVQKGSTKRPEVWQLGDLAHELKESCPTNEIWFRAKRIFLELNKESLESQVGVPWYVPQWLGGIGLPIDKTSDVSVTDYKCAHRIRKWIASGENTPCRLSAAPEWMMHQLVMKHLKDRGLTRPQEYQTLIKKDGTEESIEENFNELYKLATVELLFTHPMELLNSSNRFRSIKKALYHNQKLWSLARKSLEKDKLEVIAMNPKDMVTERKDFFPVTTKVDYYEQLHGEPGSDIIIN